MKIKYIQPLFFQTTFLKLSNCCPQLVLIVSSCVLVLYVMLYDQQASFVRCGFLTDLFSIFIKLFERRLIFHPSFSQKQCECVRTKVASSGLAELRFHIYFVEAYILLLMSTSRHCGHLAGSHCASNPWDLEACCTVALVSCS